MKIKLSAKETAFSEALWSLEADIVGGLRYFYSAFDTTRRHIDGKMRYVPNFVVFEKVMS